MRFKRGARRVRRGDVKFGQRFMRATGNRHFRADNVDQIGYTKLLAAGLFGNFRQTCGASATIASVKGTGSSSQDMLQSRWIFLNPAAT
jgi:hypothetical protein